MSIDRPLLRPATEADWPAVRVLLAASHLPEAGAHDHLADFLVIQQRGELLGCAGLERHGDTALLRSCAVHENHRGRSIGADLTRAIIDRATQSGVKQLVLLTTTAEKYFPRFGFTPVAREEVAVVLQASEEFRGACPASAAAMRLMLKAAN